MFKEKREKEKAWSEFEFCLPTDEEKWRFKDVFYGKKDLHGNGLLNQFSTSIKQQKWNVNFVMAQYLDIWKKVRHKDKGTLYRGLCTVTSTFTDSHLDWRMSCLCYWIRHPEENKCVSFWFFRERGGLSYIWNIFR